MSPRIQAPHPVGEDIDYVCPADTYSLGKSRGYKEGWDDCKLACLAAIEALPKGKIDAKRVCAAIKAALPTK